MDDRKEGGRFSQKSEVAKICKGQEIVENNDQTRPEKTWIIEEEISMKSL